jgi:hypothetical protein
MRGCRGGLKGAFVRRDGEELGRSVGWSGCSSLTWGIVRLCNAAS